MWHLRGIFISGTYFVIIFEEPVAGVDHSSIWTYMCSVTGIFIQGHMPTNPKCMYICVPGHIVDCIAFICGIYTDIVVSYVACEKHISFGMYMAISCFLSHDADGTINDTIAFLLLK